MLAAAPLAGKLMDAEKNDAKSWLPGSAESTKALEKQAAFQSPNTFLTVVVYEDNGGITAADRAKIASDVKQFAANGNLDGKVVGPFESPDHKAVQVAIPLDLGVNGWSTMPDIADSWRTIATTGTDMSVHITGPGGMAADSANAFKGIDGTLLFSAMAVVIIILLLTYRSPVLWLLPVVSAGVALFTAQAVIYLLADHAGLLVNGQSAGILTVLVFGASTDYALLLVARYREELRRHHDRHEAMAVALHRAGPAIFASAGTVIVGMLCLMTAETNSTQGLGPVAAIGVGVGLLSMLTLLPALLVICGRWVFWPRRPTEGSAEPTATGVWARVGNRIAVRPRTVWSVTAAVLAIAALGIFQLHASGLQTKDQFTTTVDSVVGEQVIEAHGFAGGAGSPVVVMANADKAGEVVSAVQAAPGIASVDPPVVRNGEAYISATLSNAPDSQAAYDTIDSLRTTVHRIDGADALVGGGTAVNLDVQRAADHDRNLIIPLVLVVVFLILALLLAGHRRAVDPHRHGRAVLRCGAGAERLGVQVRPRLPRRRQLAAAVRLRLPGGAGHRLQHLPDDAGQGGGAEVRHPAGRSHRAGRHRRRDHVRGPRAGRDVRGPRHPAAGGLRGDRLRGRARGAAGHHRRTLRARHRAQPRRRPAHVVAEHAVAQGGRRTRRAARTRARPQPRLGLSWLSPPTTGRVSVVRPVTRATLLPAGGRMV